MGGTPFSSEVFNTREELVSSDLNTAQNLLSRDVQDSLAAQSRSLDTASPLPGTTVRDLVGGLSAPISAIDQAPTFTRTGTLTANVGAGSGFSYFATGVTSNFSAYQALRWPQTGVTFAGGSGNPRIDIVYATIGSAVTLTASRNILVDPVNRTVSAQSVNKQVDPLSTIGVLQGTAAASPAIPTAALAAAHPGAVPLFYVYVPGAATDVNQFGVVRGTWRRSSWPTGAFNCPVSPFPLFWDLTVDPTTTSSTISTSASVGRVRIDGEVLQWVGTLSNANGGVVVDATASPFSVAAGAHWAKPYYIYAVGGRNNPTYTFDSGTGAMAPIILVESTIPPNPSSGRPITPLTLPAPFSVTAQAGAAYVGLGFVFPGSTRRAPCFMDDMFTYPVGAANFLGGTGSIGHTQVTGSTWEAMDTNAPPAVPLISSMATVILSSTSVSVQFSPDQGNGAAPPPGWSAAGAFGWSTPVGGGQVYTRIPITNTTAPKFWQVAGSTGNSGNIVFTGFDHRVRVA